MTIVKLLTSTAMFYSALGASVYTGEAHYLGTLVFIPIILLIIE